MTIINDHINKIQEFNNINKLIDINHLEINSLWKDKYINNKIIFLDTETTGFIGSRLVQLCYIIYNGDKFISENNIIIKPDGFTKLSDVVKFSYDYAYDVGIDIDIALNNFYSELVTTKLLVIHNAKFDISILTSEYDRLNNTNAINLLKNIDKFCTMSKSRSIVKALNKNKKIKNPTLSELYIWLFKEAPDADKLHDALYDTQCLVKCYFKLISIINIKDIYYYIKK